MKLRRTAALSVFGLLAACASVSKEDALTTIEAPTQWASLQEMTDVSSTQPVPLNWVNDLSDEALGALILEAMNNNTDLGAASRRVEIARQQAIATRASLLPTLSGSIGTSRSVQRTMGDGDYATGYSWGAQLDWEADIWGRLTDSTRAAYLDAATARADYAAARLSIAGAVAQGWYGLVAARLQRELSERDVETGQANLTITERRYERGISSSLDVRLARSSLANSQAQLQSRLQAEKEAARGLEVLLGRYPAAELASAEALPAIAPVITEEGSVIGLGTPQTMLDRRPDVISAEYNLEAAGLRASQARKALLPALRLTGSASNGSMDFEDIFDTDNLVGSLSASLVQPLFQGGRLLANAKAQQAAAEAAVFTYAGVVLNAFADVENAITAETLLAAREEALELAYEEAVAAEDLTERQYLNGTTSIFNLISAQQRRIQTESQFIAARQQRLNNRISLYLALGGTFDAGPEEFSGDLDAEGEDASPSLFRRWWQQATGTSEAANAAGADI